MKTAELGSVSSGTMRPEDLVPEFLYLLGQLDKPRHDEVVASYKETLDGEDPEEGDNYSYLLEDLFTILGKYAPPYAYFGAHEGDGADYGFWLSWDSINDAVRSGEILKIDAGSEWPDSLPEGVEYVLEVNDHGNASLFTTGGECVWAVV